MPKKKKLSFGLYFAFLYWASWGVIVLILAIIVGIIALQSGLLDGLTSSFAQRKFKNIVAQSGDMDIRQTVLRLTKDGNVAVEAHDIVFSQQKMASEKTFDSDQSGPQLDMTFNMAFQMSVAKMQIKLEPLDLLYGQANIGTVDISDVVLSFNQPEVASEKPIMDTPKIYAIERAVEGLFIGIKYLETVPRLNNLDNLSAHHIQIKHPVLEPFGNLLIKNVDAKKGSDSLIELDVIAVLNEEEYTLEARQIIDENERKIVVNLHEIDVDFQTDNENPELRFGIKTTLSTRLELKQMAKRGARSVFPDVSLNLKLSPGLLTMGGEQTELNYSELSFTYDERKKSIELVSSRLGIAQSQFPISGGIIDADNFEEGPDKGFVFDFIIDEGYLAPKDVSEKPVEFSAKAFGHFDLLQNKLVAEELIVTTGRDFIAGNAIIQLSEGKSPELNISFNTPRIETSVVKQFWPYWLGRDTRIWAKDSIYGGEIHDLRFWLHIDAGRFSNPARPIRHSFKDFQVDYDFKGARIDVVGQIPPVRNASGGMSLRGGKVVIKIDEGVSYFPSNKKMNIVGGNLIIANIDDVPLMADIDLDLSGKADAAMELISFKPIDVLGDTGLEPGDVSGLIDVRAKVRFGLIPEQEPAEPEWNVEFVLSGVDVSKPIEGRILSNINGELEVSSKQVMLSAKMDVDNIKVMANIIKSVNNSGVEEKRELIGTLDEKDRAKLKLGLGDVLFGNVDFTMIRLNNNQDKIDVNLTNSKVIAPGTGWEKAKGVRANSSFILTHNDENLEIENFRFSGHGFSAQGRMSLDKNGLKSASFPHVRLAPKDDYNFKLRRKAGGYGIIMGGKSFDMRPLIKRIKTDSGKARKISSDKTSYDIDGKIDTIYGFNGESLTRTTLRYIEEDSIPKLAELIARTDSEGSLKITLTGDKGRENITITSDDSGSFWRFFEFYTYIQGGALNFELSKSDDNPYRGKILINTFKVIGDERFKTLVSTRVNANERTLNDAFKGRLDASRVNFDQAIISMEIDNGTITIQDGIVRGPQIGAAFSGLLYDKNNNISMAGTFMPAYLVNRFFGEIPVLGTLLGNGNDKALLGITFKVSGKANNPRIQVNPLSVIAPGIFRNIFEFEK